MHRATSSNTSHRAYSAGGARHTVEEVDDKKQMQESSGGLLKREKRTKIEHAQNYGFSSVVFDATKDKNGKVKDSAEGFMTFIGGSRSFPVCQMMDDRRHRLKGMEKGDVSMYRGKEDCMQFSLTEKGFFTSCRKDKKMRTALVPEKEKKQEEQGGGGGGGEDDEATQEQKRQQDRGQKSLIEDNEKSKTFFDMQDDLTQNSNGNGSVGIEAKNNTQFEAGKHIRKGETHRDSQMFVNGNVHASDHVAGGGTTVTSSRHWNATGKEGTTSLLKTAAKVGTLGGMMGNIMQMFGMMQGLLSPALQQQMQDQMKEMQNQLDSLK